ncbi:MAG: hypothetical protein J5590_00035 [Clostridia bacterium]|nr:hypothetical protein [Clostridia bacterium]
MKLRKITALLVTFLMLLGIMPIAASADTAWRTIYVSPNGSDDGDGTQASPYKTLGKAQEAVRAINTGMQGDIEVRIAGGTYYMDEPLSFRKEDSGKNGHRVIWQGVDRPLISGGKEVTGFVPSQDHPGLYEANVDGVDRIMQIYVNGKKRWMARSNEFVKGVTKAKKYDNKDWYDEHPNDVEGASYNWYDTETPYRWDGILMSKQDIGMWENPTDILFQWERNWKTQITYPEEIMQDPDNADQVIVRMQRGFWQIMLAENYSGQAMYPDGSVFFRIINAMELLDSPGEFYYNRATKKLYYMPEADEDMSTATVVVPRLDHFATIYGNDMGDCVKNIDFKGMTIAHFASNAVAEGYWGEQGTVVRQASGTAAVGRCGVYMFFCDNVNFYDNYFYGFDEVCINMQGGVYNCAVTGNSFSDIGDAAINIGHERHNTTYEVPPENKTQMVLTRDYERMAIYTSYIGDEYTNNSNYIGILNGNRISGSTANKSFVPASGYAYKGYAWHSDPKDAENGEKSYVMYDFYSKFSIDKVALCWDNDKVSPEEKADFEVLLSNDMSFADGTYKTLHTQNGSYYGEVLDLNVNDNTKYRYLMIRTLGATPLALSQVYALTSDLKPYTFNAVPKNIKISNNYMARIGGEIPRSCAIMAYYIDGLNVTHNELFDIGYSGMEIGWGWSADNSYTRNVYCAYNNIDTTNHFLYDGGPIYTLSRQPGSIYEYNYMDNNIMGVMSLYQDSGTASTVWRNNVVENGNYVFSPYDDSHRDCVYQNNYASHDTLLLGSNAYTLNTIENPKVFAMGQPPREAWAIINNSGLEASYKHIKSWVPADVDDGLPEEAVSYIRVDDYGYRTTYGKMHKKEAENMINLGKFGSEAGQFPTKYYAELKEANNCFPTTPSVNQTVLLRNLMNDVKESVKTKSLSETMAETQELIENASVISDNDPAIASFANASLYDTFGMMTESNYKDITQRYDALKNSYTSGSADEYTLLASAETLLTDAQNAKFSADIVLASTEGAKDVNIDTENKELTFYFAPGASLADKTLALTVSPGAVIAANIPDKVDLSTPYTVPVFCQGNKGYKYWTVKAEYAGNEGSGSSGYAEAKNWFSLRRGDKHVSPAFGGGLVIEKGAFATMSTSYDADTKGASFTFAPLSQSAKHNFTMVLASQGYEIDNTLKSTTVDHLEIEFNDDLATLYQVKNGSRLPKLRDAYTPLKYNEENAISFSSSIEGNNTRVSVTINGQQVFNELVPDILNEGYFGFMSQKCNIKIY